VLWVDLAQRNDFCTGKEKDGTSGRRGKKGWGVGKRGTRKVKFGPPSQ